MEEILKLDSGYLHVRVSGECWAQIPPGFSGDAIPDEFIFQPEWSRERINRAWSSIKEK